MAENSIKKKEKLFGIYFPYTSNSLEDIGNIFAKP